MTTPIIMVNFVYTIVDSFNSMLSPAMQYINDTGFKSGVYGYASAMSMIYFLIIGIFIAIGFPADAEKDILLCLRNGGKSCGIRKFGQTPGGEEKPQQSQAEIPPDCVRYYQIHLPVRLLLCHSVSCRHHDPEDLHGQTGSDRQLGYLHPAALTLENIKAAAMTLNYGKSLMNTVVITISTTVLQVLSCMMVGYGFARHDFKGRNLLFGLVIFTVIVPPQLFTIPYFKSFREFDFFGLIGAVTGEPLNLLNSYLPFWLLGITCMGIKNGIFIYLFRQCF